MRTVGPKATFLAGLMLVTGCAAGGGTYDDPEAAREEAARAAAAPHVARAESAGNPREALGHYVAALGPLPEGEITEAEFEIRAKAIRLVGAMDPTPAMPAEAQQQFLIGEAAAKAAKNEAAYARAAADFLKGLRQAPWDAQANYNVGLLYDLQGKVEPAIRWLRLYALAAPSAPDITPVQRKIAELEVKKRSTGVEALAGIWRIHYSDTRADSAGAPVGNPDPDWWYVCEVSREKPHHVILYRVAARDLLEWEPPYARGQRETYKSGSPVNSLMRLSGRHLVPICPTHAGCSWFASEKSNVKGAGLVSDSFRDMEFHVYLWRHSSPYPANDFRSYATRRLLLRKE